MDKAKRQKEFEEMHEKTKKQEETRAMQDEGYTLVASKRKSRRRRKEFCRGYKEGKAGQDVCKEGCACEAGKVSTLRAVAPENIRNLDEAPEWEEIEVALDSGATESVCREDMLTNVETVEGDAQRKGVQYEVADGTLIPNLGEKRFVAENELGIRRQMTMQVCDVSKALLSAHKVVKAGNRVVLDDESYVEDKQTGERMPLREEGGMYIMTLWVQKGFRRQD